jgi:hypothetical protein
MQPKIIKDKILFSELDQMARSGFGQMVKGVVDLGQQTIALNGELHADLETLLLEQGGKQEDLWGINIWPAKSGSDFVEFDSMINLRPSQNNFSRSVEDQAIRAKILALVNKIVSHE